MRFDHHSEFGGNLSPSLNASYNVTETISLKAGIARAFKAPNLYQLNPSYVMFSNGNGCAFVNGVNRSCYIIGNDDLQPETSINKEVGISYNDENGWAAG